MNNNNNFLICLDISFNKTLDVYLPTAYVLKKSEKITYLDKKATPGVMKSMGIVMENLNANDTEILSICESLKVDKILHKFDKNTKQSKLKTLEMLVADPEILVGIKLFLSTKLSRLYTLISENDYPTAINMATDKDFSKGRIVTNQTEIDTLLRFEKKYDEILYTFFFKENETLYFPSEKTIHLLLDQPAWMLINKRLVNMKNINSKKIIPFLKKKTIEIPSKMITVYFEKFIKDIVQKTEIEASGFSLKIQNEVIGCHLETAYDFFKEIYYINILFDYDGYLFDNSKNKQTHSEINLETLDEIYVTRYERKAEKEQVYEKLLKKLGLQKNELGYYGIHSKNKDIDPYKNIQWVIENQESLIEAGFSINNLKIDSTLISTSQTSLKISTDVKQDWFDIEMVINCDEFEFNFSQIIPYIKEKKRLFPLPGNKFFLIPAEWLTTYASLAKFAEINNEKNIRLLKNNFTILNEIPVLKDTFSPPKELEYTSSTLLKTTLRPYQIDGVKWLLQHCKNGLGACLADDMGLGKTVQVLATLVAVYESIENNIPKENTANLFSEEIPQKEPLRALIILPSSIIFNWYNEATKFTPHFTKLRYIGSDRAFLANKIDKYDIVFTSYPLINKDIALFEKQEFRFIILDESQYIKNRASKVFKAINKIKARHRISLSGTPIENSLNDLWSQMQFINPNILGDYSFFVESFKNPIEKKQNEEILKELRKIISPFILRRTKDQVLKDLPELSEQIFYCEMEPEQEKQYEEEKSKARNLLFNIDGEKPTRINILNTLMRLRQLSNHPKILDSMSEIDSGKYFAVINYLEILIKENQKTLIFSSFLSNLDLYKKWCKENGVEYCEINGSINQKEREIQVDKFQNCDKPLLFFISLKAGGVGLNLAKASYVLFLDPWWNPFVEKQGVSRAHRMGQLQKVTAVRFISKNTIEEKIIKLQENKKLLSDYLLDENSINNDIEKHLAYLLE